VVPLRGAHQLLGYAVLVGVPRWTREHNSAAMDLADDFAVRLDTAVLFDEIRHLSAAEERNRIARDMHDGVAQEVVALGYVVDEIESVSSEPETRRLAAELRDEITRVVTELRYSIFDLRHHRAGRDLTTALTDYVQELSRDTDLRVHLVLDSSAIDLPARTQDEVMRIAQEAMSNVRRHARASNLWVTLVSDGTDFRLEIVDDGVGDAAPRERHWGLQTMQERAEGIGAELDIEPRFGGGTVVRLHATPSPSTQGSARHEHHRPAHR
jgi:signal transduction histidine kinase